MQTVFDSSSPLPTLPLASHGCGTLPSQKPITGVILMPRYSLRASSPIWASEASLARTRERAAKLRGPSLARSREAHFAYPNRRACSQASRGSVNSPWGPQPSVRG